MCVCVGGGGGGGGGGDLPGKQNTVHGNIQLLVLCSGWVHAQFVGLWYGGEEWKASPIGV